MAAIDQIISVSVSVASNAPSRAGFGTPMIAVYHTKWLDRIREYSEVSELVDDGFDTTDAAYKAASVLMAQNPRPSKFKIGRRASAFTQTFDLTPVNTTEGFKYEFDVISPDGTVTEISYTNGGAETVATIVTELSTLLTAITDFTATDTVTHIACEADNAGELFDILFKKLDPKDDLKFEDTTADPGLAADLTAIDDVDSEWYGLGLDSNGSAEIQAAFAWLANVDKIGSFHTSDSDIVDVAVDDDLFSTLSGLNYEKAVPFYSQKRLLNYTGIGALGRMLPTDPGSATWAHKTLVGVTSDGKLKGAYRTQINLKGGSWYAVVKGVDVTYEGKTPGGEWIDVNRFVHWLVARIQERMFFTLINNDKIPYTNIGAQTFAGDVRAILKQGQDVGGLSTDTAPIVTVPDVKDIDPAEKIARHLPDLKFSGVLAGAIHSATVSGKLSV